MALFIQLNSYTIQQKNRQDLNLISADRLENILINLKKSLTLGGTQNIFLDQKTPQNRLRLAFTAEVDSHSELCFQFWLAKTLSIKSHIVLGHKGSYIRIRSHEIRKNMCKILSFVNTVNKKSQIFLTLNSRTGQLHFSPSYNLGRNQSKQTITLNLKSLITQCMMFAKNFNSLLLYKSNLINKYTFYRNCSEKIRSLFFSSSGEFANLNKIHQFLSLSNCKISYSLKQTKNAKYQKGHNQLINLQRVRDKFYNRTYTHDIALYCQKSFWDRTKNTNMQPEDYNSLMMSYKPRQCKRYDNNYLFSTVSLQQQPLDIQKKQHCIAQTQKVKNILIHAKIKYGMTLPYNDLDKIQNQSLVSQEIYQNTLDPAPSKQIEKYLVVKMAKPKLSLQMRQKILQMINYEKMILRNLRGAECRYLPKFYQAQHKNLNYRDSLLIDYIPGSTLATTITQRIKQMTLAWKINLLMHLSNALRFLQTYDIAHLDFSVNNIIIGDNDIPKIIDFGEAYHQQTTLNFLKLKKEKRNSHRPGRTFPFAPPETTLRDWKFNSKQDIFSLGIIAFYLILGYFPNNCSQKNIPKWYINGNFNQSIFFSPQGVEWIAENELVLSCLQLILNCLHNNQKMRPNPSWVHIIFLLMLELINANN